MSSNWWCVGSNFANMIFDLDIISISDNKRLTSIFLSEIIATFGLLITILLVSKQKIEMVAPAVGLYIGAAYWFTSSTSFSNPVVTIEGTLVILLQELFLQMLFHLCLLSLSQH